jgi:pre-rRNA-processing protein TSR3
MIKMFKLHVYHTNDDDPKKCTARKLNRLGYASLHTKIRELPPHMILLNPFSKKSLSPEDTKHAEKHGILSVDCSWKTAEQQFFELSKTHVSRALPFVIAVNSVNFGKPLKLTTLEAFAAAVYILGNPKQAEEVTSIYKWSPHFLTMNKNPLEDYRTAKNSKEVIQRMHEYLPAEKDEV